MVLTLTELCKSDECPFGHTCRAWTCLPGEEKGTRPGCGQKRPSDPVTKCAEGLECHRSKGSSWGECIIKRGRMKLCARDYHCEWDEQCKDHKCVKGTLRQRPRCLGNEDCWFGHYCLNGTCEKQPFWEPSKCEKTKDCSRGKLCHGGVCVVRATLKNSVSNSELCHSNNQCLNPRTCDQGLCVGLHFRMLICHKSALDDRCGLLPGYKCNATTGTLAVPGVCHLDSKPESLRDCTVDQDCPIGEVCHQVASLPSKCRLFYVLFGSKKCSWDGHCYSENCIRDPGEQEGTCKITTSRPERRPCKTKDDCDDYYYCSFGRCTYPQRRMQPGEPLPCLTDAECPSQRVCYRYGCVLRSYIPRGYCSDDEQCINPKYGDFPGHTCFDGFCVKKDLVPRTERLPGSKFQLYQPNTTDEESLGIPSRFCSNDLGCLAGELCMGKKGESKQCVFQKPRQRCGSNGCNSEADLCYLGRCISILE